MNRAVIFDVNEKILELGALDPLFAGWFGDPVLMTAWFSQTLQFAMTLAATRALKSFSELGAAA
jgi:2-haloacid dehalogenase